MKHTNLLLFTCLNLFICLITIIVCTSYNDNHNSYAISEKTTKITNTYNDSIFDVADYIDEEFTPIDINSKNYGEGISILDSNFQISSKLLKPYLKEETFISYLFPILRYHSRWNELTADDFKYFFDSPQISYNGYYIRVDSLAAENVPEGRRLLDYSFGDKAWS